MTRIGTAAAVTVLLSAIAPAAATDVASDLVAGGRLLLDSTAASVTRSVSTMFPDIQKRRRSATVVTRYPPANLAEPLAEGIMSGHPDMPEFVFEPDEIDAIIGYLEWLQGAGAP